MIRKVKQTEKDNSGIERLEEIEIEKFLPKIQIWEMRARDLLAHRCKMAICNDNARIEMITNYITRIEEIDEAFLYMKKKESRDELEGIVVGFEREQHKKQDILDNDYLISNNVEKILAENRIHKKNNDSLRQYIKECTTSKKKQDDNKITSDNALSIQFKSISAEIDSIRNELKELKGTLYENYGFFEKTSLVKVYPLAKTPHDKELVVQRQISSNRFMDWYAKLVSEIERLKLRPIRRSDVNDMKAKLGMHDNSTTIDVSRSKDGAYDSSDFIDFQPGRTDELTMDAYGTAAT